MNYYNLHAKECKSIEAKSVSILIKQHIGAPGNPCISVGDTVKKGDLIVKAKEGSLSVNMHASIDGRITLVDGERIVIDREKE